MSLVVDGTAKLAAKSKPNDKHEAPDLNIEEATVASPRPSRKRAGDFFDFDDGTIVGPSSKPFESNAKPRKSTNAGLAGNDGMSHDVEVKPAAAAKRGKKEQEPKKEVAGSPNVTTTKVIEKEKRPRKSRVTKDDSAGEKPESSKKPKKVLKEPIADKNRKTDAIKKAAKTETKTKAKKSKIEESAAEQESSTVTQDAHLDEEPFQTLLESQGGQAPKVAKESSATGAQATKAVKATKAAKRPAKEPKASKIELAKTSAAETIISGAKLVETGVKAGNEKVKKAANTKTPAADGAGDIEKAVKVGTKKAKQAVKSLAPAAKTPAGVADVVKKDAEAGAEKTKAAKSKVAKTAQSNESGKLTESIGKEEAETSKSRKRKAFSSADAETVKADILDPLSDHASATKKLKKVNTKSKSIGGTVGEFLTTATEGASAARASLGGLANSILGGASEAVEGAIGAKKSAKASAKKAKGNGKAIAEDVAESSRKMAVDEGPGNTDLEDDFSDAPDDHTTALLAGFESDGDGGTISGSGFQKGQMIPALPHMETTAQKLEDVKRGTKEGSGVVYVGRIPHGFYEHEMREYFSQFGDISRLRLSRSRKNGGSKHYAFVEFTSAGVAEIVADTMDNYLMFGHILKCKLVAKEQIHESMWKGADRRFKVVPWNKIEGRKLEVGLGRQQWAGRIEGEKKRRSSKNERTKEIGYEFEAGELKGVDQVPVRNEIENGAKVDEEKSLVTAGGEGGEGAVVVVSEEIKIKRAKKVKGKTEETNTAVAKETKRTRDAGEEAVGSGAKKARKGKNAAI